MTLLTDRSGALELFPSLQGSRRPWMTLPFAFAVLIGCQLVGEVVRQALRLPLPGPLIGMFLLTLVLMAGGSVRQAVTPREPSSLDRAANGLIANMGLLFVPAGVGVVAQMDVLRREWLPILAGLLVSTVLGLLVTGLVMHHVSRFVEARQQETS